MTLRPLLPAPNWLMGGQLRWEAKELTAEQIEGAEKSQKYHQADSISVKNGNGMRTLMVELLGRVITEEP
jgi:hypothetical protein